MLKKTENENICSNAVSNTSSKGMAIETIGYLVLAIVALILLWVFLNKLAPHITTMVNRIVKDLICYICDKILGMWKGAAQLAGFCSGC